MNSAALPALKRALFLHGRLRFCSISHICHFTSCQNRITSTHRLGISCDHGNCHIIFPPPLLLDSTWTCPLKRKFCRARIQHIIKDFIFLSLRNCSLGCSSSRVLRNSRTTRKCALCRTSSFYLIKQLCFCLFDS